MPAVKSSSSKSTPAGTKPSSVSRSVASTRSNTGSSSGTRGGSPSGSRVGSSPSYRGSSSPSSKAPSPTRSAAAPSKPSSSTSPRRGGANISASRPAAKPASAPPRASMQKALESYRAPRANMQQTLNSYRSSVPQRTITGPTKPVQPAGTKPANVTRNVATKYPSGIGKKYGAPDLKNVEDRRKWQGPPTYEAALDKRIDDAINKYKGQQRASAASFFGPKRTKNAAEMNARILKENADVGELMRERHVIKNYLKPKPIFSSDDKAFRQEISESVPGTKLPSRMGLVDKALSGYKSMRESWGDSLYGPTEKDDGELFKRGGLVSRKKKTKGK